MFINPTTAIEKGWIKFPEWMDNALQEKCIQPNAIDFTLDRVFRIKDNLFKISEEYKEMRGSVEEQPIPITLDGLDKPGWICYRGAYDCLSDFYVELPEGVAAMMVTRSTFVRNGLFWVSGLFDTGFKGHIGGVLHNNTGSAYIAKGTRIGQIIFVDSDSAGTYAGGWNHEVGTHYTEGK